MTPLRHRPWLTQKTILWAAAHATILVLAIALRMSWPTNPDTSWLLDIAQRTIDGAVPYRDFLEVNPPASILIYIPSAWFAHETGLRPETATDLLMFVGTAISLTLSGLILIRADLPGRTGLGRLSVAASTVLLILPLNSFAQREHIVLLAILPVLAAMAVRCAGCSPGWASSMLAGIGAGVAVSVKPVFGLALLGPALDLIRRRSWRALITLPEAWIPFGMAAAYSLAVATLYPDFVKRILPLATTIYLPARLQMIDLIASPAGWTWAAAIGLALYFRSLDDHIGRTVALASAGFAASFLIQGKGFAYHAYPAVALAILSCASALSHGAAVTPSIGPRLRVMLGLVSTGLGCVVFAEPNSGVQNLPGLTSAIAAIAPHPRLLTISGDITLGRIYARSIGAEWVGSTPMPWIICYARIINADPETDPRFADAIRMERDVYAADIEQRHPDVILLDGGWIGWTQRSPALARALSDYTSAGLYGHVRLFRRKPMLHAMSDIEAGAVEGTLAETGAADRGTSR